MRTVVDPGDRSLVWLVRDGDGYRQVEHSPLLDVVVADVARQIDWPPVDKD